MMRLFEFIVALIMVAVLAVIVGISLPGTGHVQRSLVFSKNIRDVYDLFNNFRRFPDYAVLRAYDPQMVYHLHGKAYGPGAGISWTSNNSKVGNGSLKIASATPGFENVEDQGDGKIVWTVDNDWRGSDKHFTIDMTRTGRQQNLVKVTWSYDVKYGWNLFNRYSGLYIHGAPDQLVQYSLDNLENLLASIPHIDYNILTPEIVQRPQKPVLFVSTTAKRSLEDVADATDAATKKLHAAMKKLGVKQAGPVTTFTTNFGDTKYDFDVAIPIDSSTLKIDGTSYELQAPKPPKLAGEGPASGSSAAGSSSTATGSSVASAGSSAAAGSAASGSSVAAAGSAPASASSAGNAQPVLKPGTQDERGHLTVTKDGVQGMLAFGGKALKGVWKGSAAGIPPTRLMLQAYALTHGYHFDEVVHRLYDQTIPPPAPKSDKGKTSKTAKDSKPQPAGNDQEPQTEYDVYLPLSWAPDATPVQLEAEQGKGPLANPPPTGNGSPTSAGSAPTPAGSASVPAASAPSSAGTAPSISGG